MKEHGYSVGNVDSTINLEKPKVGPYIEEMRKALAVALEIETDRISIKAKTGEKVDAVGESRAIRADAVVMLTKT
jgi:2-C-methyl-D-erythritol 2,4-cyclodiphosphate synthase